ncbi:hypothetical protein HDU98_010028 [Podochytrium sp. JEL0797]|nr:hypothetical protein HDU98_010028 [Podochytrium sp. JEL0797]
MEKWSTKREGCKAGVREHEECGYQQKSSWFHQHVDEFSCSHWRLVSSGYSPPISGAKATVKPARDEDTNKAVKDNAHEAKAVFVVLARFKKDHPLMEDDTLAESLDLGAETQFRISYGSFWALSSADCEKYAALLQNPEIEVAVKLKCVTEIRDSMDIVHSIEYPRFLTFLVPAFRCVLNEVEPGNTSGAPQHKLRNSVIEIIHRLPLTEALRNYATELMTVLMSVLKSDNEENAVIALKVVVELHKIYKAELEGHVQAFFDVVLDMYRGMKKAVEDAFDDPTSPIPPEHSAPGGGASTEDANRALGPSMTSFKVLTECPIIIALLLQVHRNFVNSNVPLFVPLIMETLLLQPRAQRLAHESAAANGTIFFGVSPEIKNRVAYSEFKALQVKTASFIAYILRSFVATLKPHQDEIAEAIVGLLKDCPPEASVTRKELLVAIRHIWYTEFKSAFVKHFDVLLNENVLLGAGVTSRETLRPLAHSILVDLIHHIRGTLTSSQLAATIHLYARNLHDDSLSPNIQHMCAKLLVNLVDCLQDSSKPINRVLLIRILEAFAHKFTAMKNAFPSVMKHIHRNKAPINANSLDSFEVLPEMDGYVDLGMVQPIKTSARAFDGTHNLIKDMRFLVRMVIEGIKPVLTTLRSFNPPGTGISDTDPTVVFTAGFSPLEVQLFSRILRDGLKCFDYLASENFGADGKLLHDGENSPLVAKEEKDVYESFAAIFTYVEPCVFQDVFSTQMPYFFERILLNGALQAIPQYLLGLVNVVPSPTGSPNFTSVSPAFGGLLLRFLVDRIEHLSGEDKIYSGTMLRLYKVVFMAVTKYPKQNESILKPHVSCIIMKSMKLSSTAKDPLNYFLLLRALFRSIGGGRFEKLYEEVLPLLEVLLEGLNVLLSTANKQSMKELFVELCLTVPVRLNVLLPYLSFLMKPLVLALQGGTDLVSQGLRTLELCVDNLTQDFLEPIMAPVSNELMEALWKHLKPLPYKWEHSHTTMRILGKLGGRNRRLLNQGKLLEMDCPVNAESGVELLFAFHQKLENPQVIALDPLIVIALKVLEDPDCLAFHQEQVFLFAKACIPLLVSFDDATEDIVNVVLEADAPVDAMDVDSEAAPAVSPFIDSPLVRKEKKEASDKALCDIVSLLFMCTVIPPLKDRARLLLENLCQHFAFLSVAEALDLKRKQKGREPSSSTIDGILNAPTSAIEGFITAIVRSMTSENDEQRAFTEKSLKLFYSISCSIVKKNGKMAIQDLPVFHSLASKYNSCCYKQEWFEKSGGCLGISLLTSQMEFGLQWMLDHELEFIKALLYVLKDVSPEMATSNAESAKHALMHVLKVCNSPVVPQEASEGEDGNTTTNPKFSSLISLLISELSNSNGAVRETIQETFQQLALMTGHEVSQLLLPVRERLLQPIFSKPLRALPFALQIGHIDAITYCLSLRPSLLTFDDQLIRLLSEALALADAEDQALVSKPSHYKNSASLTNLRVVCIKLLSAAMACAEFSGARQVNTRARIIAVFFKSLYAKTTEVVDVAYQGLALVLSQEKKLPKELLQAGLKPILVNLQDYKRLTVSVLDGLARLLELLTSYFKVEIGKKLLDHCRQWAEPSVLSSASGRPLTEIDEIKVMVAMLNVFHLLPPAANCFMEDLVKTILDLEAGLRRTISSPFRTPLVKFLNRYSTEAMEFFFNRLGDSNYSCLFISVLADENANPLRVEVLNNTTRMIEATYENASADASRDHLSGVAIEIIKVISAFRPTWILQEQKLGACVREHWKRIRNSTNISELSLNKSQEYRNVLEVFITVASNDPSQCPILYEILEGFSTSEVLDVSFLKQFFYERVCLEFTPAQKRAIVHQFWEDFGSAEMSDGLKILGLRYMVIPIIQASFAQNVVSQIVDAEMIGLIQTRIWHPDQDLSSLDDFLRVELLQFSTLLIQCASEVTNESKKDVIKFAWNQIKVEDVTCKQATYVLLSNFIHEYETPPKIATQIYVALLKAHQAETRVLVKQALDVMLPVASKRVVAPGGSGESKLPTFIRWTKKIISEDGHNLSQLLTLYQLLIRHAELFYPFRDHFIGNIVSSFARLGLLTNATAETKTISIDLCDLILKWENMRVKEMANQAEAMVVDESEHDAASNANNKETVIGYLIRFVSSSLEPNLRPSLVLRAVSLLKSLLAIWTDAVIKFSHFDKAVVLELKEDSMPIIRDTIDVLETVLENRPSEWIVSHLSSLQKPIELWIQSDNPSVVKAMSQVLGRAYSAAVTSPEASDVRYASDVTAFVKMVDSVISKLLQTSSNLFALLSILKTVHETKPEILDERNLIDLMKLLGKLSKDHLNASSNNLAGSEMTTTMLIMLLELVRNRMSGLKDYRRPFHDCLAQLISESHDVNLLNCLLGIMDEWIFRNSEPFPTLKEKANLVFKMMVLETRGDKDLSERYLNLIASIYEDPKLARSELTVRLEQAFLMGTNCENPSIREKFSTTLNKSLESSLFPRLQYVVGIQNWEFLSNSFWIRQALDLLLGCIDWSQPVNTSNAGYRVSAANFGIKATHANSMALDNDPASEHSKYMTFVFEMRSMDVGLIMRAAREFNYLDSELSATMWISLFPLSWELLNTGERQVLTKLLILLLGKDYNLKQANHRPNVVATLLEGACKCIPPIELPPQLVKYVGKNFNAWHTSLELLQNAATAQREVMSTTKEEERLKEITLDALGDMLSSLSEDDYLSGLWRRRCLFSESNSAVSFEQCGLWVQAQNLYESAQTKARTGLLPFTESEYNMWEDHWVTCAKKLQQWDILLDLSKHEGNMDLLLESAWRLSDWFQERESLTLSLRTLPDNKSPRKKVFEALLALLKAQESGTPDRQDFKKLCDEGIQLALTAWYALPPIVANAHIPLLHTFQLYVELQEASQIQENLLQTGVNNIDQKSQELKGILITWRERLPNVWDDINIWSDLVSWRQHIFSMVNKAYLPLIPQLQPQGGASNPTSSYAYRGYHETAWIINRFSHVARKHGLTDVCISSLTKIYTLPNIEIPEAFYKLREQAKCHFQSPNEYPTGLDVINNTNLHYFSTPQSAEFFSLKGVFLAKMGLHEDAVQAFASATQMEMTLPKAWAAWGQYNDHLFKENPLEIKCANEAVQCYLQAAGIYNNARSRKYIARLIWLMALDDSNQTLAMTFEAYKSETPLWYWITFIPQLLSALSGKEAKYARTILMKIAKSYPQALHFQLRTTKEDFTVIKKQGLAMAAAAAKANEAKDAAAPANAGPSNAGPSNAGSNASASVNAAGSTPAATTAVSTPLLPSAPTPSPALGAGMSESGAEATEMDEDPKPKEELVKQEGAGTAATAAGAVPSQAPQPPAVPILPVLPGAGLAMMAPTRRQPWEYVEEIMALLKTAFPLLTLSMETMVDQINQRLKPSSDEDIYRLVTALLSDGIQQLSKDFGDSSSLSPTTEVNLLRFADSMKPNHMKYKALFEEDFIKSKPNLTQLVDNFRNWRDKLEILLDNRPRKQHLEYFSHYLVEFEYQKFDEIEVPGQYFLLKDNNKDFIRIDRFQPEVEVLRGVRRLTIRGHDGSLHPFIVQHPAARNCRREERIIQLFRIFNGVLERKISSRRRGLQFHLPIIVPLAPMVRIVADDPSYKTLQDIFEDHCHTSGIHRDDPILYFIQKMREMHGQAEAGKKGKVEILNLKTELMQDIANRMIPENILSKYMIKNMRSYTDLWIMRKQFTHQMAAVTFMTYLFSIGHRHPSKFHISMKTGDIWTSDLLPTISNANFLISNVESVPFRLTPNIQHFITPMGMEGVFTSGVMSIARALTEPESDLDDYLSIFIRDELLTSQSNVSRSKQPAFQDPQLRDLVNQNCDLLTKRTHALACKLERERGIEDGHPANQTILDLISQAGNPLKLAQMDPTFLAML